MKGEGERIEGREKEENIRKEKYKYEIIILKGNE